MSVAVVADIVAVSCHFGPTTLIWTKSAPEDEDLGRPWAAQVVSFFLAIG